MESEVKTFSQIYELEPEAYSDIKVDALPFSVRVMNRMYRMGVNTVCDLLNLNPEILQNIPGFGAKCQDEIINYVKSLTLEKREVPEVKHFIPNELFAYKTNIIKGQYDFVKESDLSKEALETIEKMQQARSIIDAELIDSCFFNTECICTVLTGIRSYTKKMDKLATIRHKIYEINKCRLANKALPYVYAYSQDDNVRTPIIENIQDESESLESLVTRLLLTDNLDTTIEKFIKWLSFNVQADLDSYLIKLRENEREYRILQLRSQKKTLEHIGIEYGLTRERVRQIEGKAIRKFRVWEMSKSILQKIYADRDGDSVLTSNELMDYFGQDFSLFMYLFKETVQGDIIYDHTVDSFIIGDSTMQERVQEFVDGLPDTFYEGNVQGIIYEAEEQNLSSELVYLKIDEIYLKTGEMYHRERLSLAKLYADIMRRYYPNGLHIYSHGELEVFKKHIKDDYDIELDQSDHAIGSVIARIGVLCGRGRYRLLDSTALSDELALKIYDFIENGDSPVYLTNTIFSVFEEELLAAGIDNKYYIHGLLRNRFGDRWFFRRDYISKDSNFTSIYASIVSFIKKSPYPIKKEEIFKEYPGITEIVVNLAISDPEVLNLFGSYIHGSRLKISASDKDYIEKVISLCLGEKEICHCKSVFDYIMNDYPSLLKNNYISIPFCMYSLIEYCFGDNYNLSRPYIARNGVEIETSYDMLREMVKDSDTMEISAIQSYARNNFRQIYSILEFIDACNETHLLINKEEIASIELIQVNAEICSEIEQIISEEIDKTTPISRLKCINRFPKVQFQWSEWLIYSVIKKWGTQLEVAASSNKFNQSIPLISIAGKMNTTPFINAVTNSTSTVMLADDLSNIDELISDLIISEDILDDL